MAKCLICGAHHSSASDCSTCSIHVLYPDAPHLVVDVEFVDMAAIHDQLEDLSSGVYMHALELPRLMVASFVAVKRKVPEPAHGGPDGI